MAKKIMGITLLASSAYLLSQSLLDSNSFLFLFAGSSLWINLLIIFLSFIVVLVSYKRKFSGYLTYQSMLILAAALIIFGVSGILISQITYYLYSYFGVLDYIVMLECGLILAFATLTCSAPSKQKSSLRAAFIKSLKIHTLETAYVKYILADYLRNLTPQPRVRTHRTAR